MPSSRVKFIRAEVISENVQKYASSNVYGGEGYVTTINGATYGSQSAVNTEVKHHIKSDIWVRDLKTGNEQQIQIADVNFPVRAGHIIRATFDEDTKQWERLHNETTNFTTDCAGLFNSLKIAQQKAVAPNGWAYVIGLSIPVINLLVGFIAAIRIIMAPTSVCGQRLNGAKRSILAALIFGFVLFAASFTIFFMVEVDPRSKSTLKMVSAWGFYLFSLTPFVRALSHPHKQVLEYMLAKSKLHDQLISNAG